LNGLALEQVTQGRHLSLKARGQAAELSFDDARGDRQQAMGSQRGADVEPGLAKIGVLRIEHNVTGERIIRLPTGDERQDDMTMRA
jgi:hypothetical protein